MNKSQLHDAIERILELDALEIVEDFRAWTHERAAGTYCAFVFDPKDGSIARVNEPSACCSEEEYFKKNGLLSRRTILSCTAQHWSPSPQDGFEWDYVLTPEDAKYFYPKGNPWDWKSIEELPEDADEEQFEFFNVSSRPVDGWVPDGWQDYEVQELEKTLKDWVKQLEEEIEEEEEEEEADQ